MTLALGIALLPPIWALISPYMGISTATVALICAAVYVASGNKIEDGVRISIGFLCGDVWACCALEMMSVMQFDPNVELFTTLFVLGLLAVIISALFTRWIYLPAWLCGWAVGLTIITPDKIDNLGSLAVQVGASMLVGVWYIGAGVDRFQKLLLKLYNK